MEEVLRYLIFDINIEIFGELVYIPLSAFLYIFVTLFGVYGLKKYMINNNIYKFKFNFLIKSILIFSYILLVTIIVKMIVLNIYIKPDSLEKIYKEEAQIIQDKEFESISKNKDDKEELQIYGDVMYLRIKCVETFYSEIQSNIDNELGIKGFIVKEILDNNTACISDTEETLKQKIKDYKNEKSINFFNKKENEIND